MAQEQLTALVLPDAQGFFRMPGGMFAGVFYHPDQIALGTGGPKDAAMLGTLNEMQQALAGLEWLIAEHEVIILGEGSRHQGESSVLHLLGCKP